MTFRVYSIYLQMRSIYINEIGSRESVRIVCPHSRHKTFLFKTISVVNNIF